MQKNSCVQFPQKGKEYPIYDKDKLIVGDEDGLPHNFAQFDSKCAKPTKPIISVSFCPGEGEVTIG